MSNNLITNLYDVCMPLVLDSFNGSLSILYYSHIPTVIFALFFGLYILFKGEKILSKVFFLLTLLFSAWSILDLYTWLSVDSRVIMFTWSLTSLVEPLIFIFSFYFIYCFIEKRDVSFKYKLYWGGTLLFLLLLIPTSYNLSYFSVDECYSIENSVVLYYKYFLEIVTTILILIFSFIKMRRLGDLEKKQLWILLAGILFFLLSFFSVVFLGGYLSEMGWGMAGYKFELYGLFGMTFFIGVLAYLVVQYKMFNIKLISAQAIMIALIMLIASQFAFIQNPTNLILNGITLFLSVIFGWQLVKSVKKEVSQKEELIIINEKLKKIDQAKSEFISIASHQLRTPLTVIKGYISMIIEGNFGELSASVKEALSKVDISNERLIKLVEELLNVSRIESGKLRFTFEYKQLEDLVASVCDELTGYAAKKNLKFEYIKPLEKLPPVRMDEDKLRQAVMNLVDNSIKYTNKGSVTVSLIKLNDMIRFCVSDSGIGVRAEDMPNLFKKFSRGSGSLLIHTEGTGLGLFVVKQMIESHGGRAWLESAGEGKGSKFYFDIPFVK